MVADLPDLIPPWLLGLWAVENTRYALLLLLAAGLVSLAFRSSPKPKQPQAGPKLSQDEAQRPTNTSAWRRLLWRVRPPRDLMRVDGLAIDRTRKPHAAWLGPTGAGKSSAVAVVRCNTERVWFAVTPDLSDPIIAAAARAGGFHWTAGVSAVAIDFMPKRRSPNDVAEYLTEVFRSGGVGAWKRKAYLATADVVRRIDDADEQRSFGLIAQRLKEMCAKDRELKMVCEGWIGRFESVSEKFGSSVGPHGLDLADLIKRNIPVLLDNDAFKHPGLVEDVVALGLAEGKAIADELPLGFRLIFEEAGQLGDRIELAYPFFRAGRRRNIAVDVLTQAETDLKYHGNDAITSNIATHVYFEQTQKSLQQLAVDRLGLAPSNMADFTAYVSHGRIRRLVRFPKPPAAPRQRTYENEPANLKTQTPSQRRFIVEELAEDLPNVPALAPPRLEVQELLDQIDRSGHCHVWQGTQDEDGYGIFRWNGNWKRVHRIVWELTCGPIPLDAKGKPLDLDHHCRNRLCSKIDHLEPVTRGENVRRMWQYRARKGRAAI